MPKIVGAEAGRFLECRFDVGVGLSDEGYTALIVRLPIEGGSYQCVARLMTKDEVYDLIEALISRGKAAVK